MSSLRRPTMRIRQSLATSANANRPRVADWHVLVREGESACLAIDSERRHVVSVLVAHVEEHTGRVQGKTARTATAA